MVVFKSESTPQASAGDSGRPAPPRPPSSVPPRLQRTRTSTLRSQRKGRIAGARRIKAKELPPFSRQLSAMLLAGMPLIQALDALEDQTSDKHFKILVAGLKNNIQAGAAFSEALSHYPAVFDDLYINMMKAGETGGQLGETAGRLAGFLEDAAKLSRKVKSAMSYPVIVLCLAIGIAIAMIIFIVPVFAGMFADFDAKLPAPTQFLVNLSQVMRHYSLAMLAALVAGAVLFRQWKNTPAGSYRLAGLMLKLPVLGELNRRVATSRFARTFAQLLQSGVPILRAMEIVSGATGNKVFEQVILDARSIVEKGEPISNALMQHACFPRLLIHMLAAGEKTGKVDEMMQSIADFYDSEVEAMLDGLTALIEPLLMVFLGVVIGGVVVSMFLPIFKMGEVVGGY